MKNTNTEIKYMMFANKETFPTALEYWCEVLHWHKKSEAWAKSLSSSYMQIYDMDKKGAALYSPASLMSLGYFLPW